MHISDSALPLKLGDILRIVVAQGAAIHPMMEVETVFKALGDTNRLRIVNLLLHGELCVCDIQYVLENSQPNISRHLAYLKRSEMVLDRRDGYRVFYRLASAKTSRQEAALQFSQGNL